MIIVVAVHLASLPLFLLSLTSEKVPTRPPFYLCKALDEPTRTHITYVSAAYWT